MLNCCYFHWKETSVASNGYAPRGEEIISQRQYAEESLNIISLA